MTDRLRLEARLTDPHGTPTWSGKHDDDLADSFDRQDEIGQAVAAQVYGHVFEAERAKSILIPFDKMTGEHLLFRALMEFRSLTEADIRNALQYGTEAIEPSPTLTQAVAASSTFLVMPQMSRYDRVRLCETRFVDWVQAARPVATESSVGCALVGCKPWVAPRRHGFRPGAMRMPFSSPHRGWNGRMTLPRSIFALHPPRDIWDAPANRIG